MTSTPPPAPLRQLGLFPKPTSIAHIYVVVISDPLLPLHHPYDCRLCGFNDGTILPIDSFEWVSIIKGYQRHLLHTAILNKLSMIPGLEAFLWAYYGTTYEQNIQQTTAAELNLGNMVSFIYNGTCRTKGLFTPEMTMAEYCTCPACFHSFVMAINKMEMISLKRNMTISVATKLSHIIANPSFHGQRGLELLQHAFRYAVRARLNLPTPRFTDSSMHNSANRIALRYNAMSPQAPIYPSILEAAMSQISPPPLPPNAGFLALVPFPSPVWGSEHVEEQDLDTIISTWSPYANDNPDFKLRSMNNYYASWKRENTEIGSENELRSAAQQYINAKRTDVLCVGARLLLKQHMDARKKGGMTRAQWAVVFTGPLAVPRSHAAAQNAVASLGVTGNKTLPIA